MQFAPPLDSGNPSTRMEGFSIESALDQWRSMRLQLSNTIRSYISACKTLEVVCVRDRRTRAGTMAEQVFTQLDAELESLATEEYALVTTRLSLSTLRNKSETLVPLNLLPPETLTQIFTLSVSNCRQHHCSFPYAFANTCVYWRQLALDTPHFWTHIDLGPGIPWKLSKLMLERAKTNSLHLHIYKSKNFIRGNPSWNNLGWDVSNLADLDSGVLYYGDPLIKLVGHFAHQVQTFELSSNELGCDIVGYIAKLWLNYGDKDLAKSLLVYQSDGHVLLDDSQEDDTEINTSEHGRDVLLSLRTLRLYCTRFNWDSNAYHGLVDLQLGFETTDRVASISSLELVHILTASPRLAVLRLNRLRVTHTENLSQAIPIPLNHLRVLNLTDTSPASLKELLPLIALPRSSSPELRVGLEVCAELEKELRDLFARSSITTLYCLCPSYASGYEAWSSILAPLDSLHTLILDMGQYNAQPEHGILSSQGDTTSQLVTSSRPLSLTLRRCCPSFTGLKSLITNLGIHELRIENPPSISYYSIDQSIDEYWQNIGTALLQTQPNLRYIIEKHAENDNPHRDILPGYLP